MIIRCVKLFSQTTGEVLGFSPWVTINKEYIVFAVAITLNQGGLVVIKSDQSNKPVFMKLEGFEIISQKIPKSWQMQVIDNFYFYMMPESWMYEDFFEDLSNDELKAMEIFKKEADLIYQFERND